MKLLTLHVRKEEFDQVIAPTNVPQMIVLTDGERQIALDAGSPCGEHLNLEEDSSALATELLKAADGPFTPYSSAEMNALVQKIIREEKGK